MENSLKEDTPALGRKLLEYCEKYSVPIEYVFDVLNDQKVVPMIRGKATEFNGYIILTANLNLHEWSVQKLNLNAQPNASDEDISLTHRRTGIILKVECKNAVRGSMRSGIRTKKYKVPHCKIKCHRSRSNIRLANSTNDRYSEDHFDIIIANLSNALFQGRTVGDKLELIYDNAALAAARDYYKVQNDKDLLRAASNDWRFVFPRAIAENGFIPRTPYLMLENDPNWRPISELEHSLIDLIREKTMKGGQGRRRTKG